MNDKYFWELQRTLSGEFSKYVLSHPELDEQIPDGAQVVFNLEDNHEFNDWAMKTAHSQQEPNQPIIIVTVKELMPVPASRMVNPQLKLVANM